MGDNMRAHRKNRRRDFARRRASLCAFLSLPSMISMARLGSLAIFGLALLWLPRMLAQGESSGGTAERADAEINAAYQACLKHFTGDYKKQLRVAQRAWIAFSNEQEAASELTGKNHDLAQDVMDEEALKEVRARTNQLRAFFILPNQDLEACRKTLDEADADLTVAYKRSLDSLSAEEQNKLQQAERAWIEFRDQNARAHVGDPSDRAPVWASTVVTRRRTEQLQTFYGKLPSLALANPPTTPSPLATPIPLDPEVRVRIAADFRAEIAQLLAKSAGESWLKNHPSSLKGITVLRPALAEVVQKVADDAGEFRRTVGYDEKTLTEFKDDTAVVDSLKTYAAAADQLHTGNAIHASETLDSFHQEYAEAPGTQSKALWEAVDSIRSLLDRLHEESKAYIAKASALSDAGKTGSAVQEYQNAYQVFPDPAVAEQIKKLREESLGL